MRFFVRGYFVGRRFPNERLFDRGLFGERRFPEE